jgi:MscS family membrane protein
VEAVGLRSTRIRTLYDSLLVVPNGKLADTTINNLEARRHRTLNTTVLVTSGGTPEKLQNFTRAIAERISSDPIFERHAEVNTIGIVASGIQIEILLDIKTQHGFEARAATHRLLIDIMRLAEAEGLTLGRGMEKNPVYYLQEP